MATTHDYPQGLFKEVWEVEKIIFEGFVSRVGFLLRQKDASAMDQTAACQ